MKYITQILVFGAFLAGAYLSVLDPLLVNWAYMVPVLIVGVIGLVGYLKTHRAEARSGTRISGNMSVLTSSLENIVNNLEALEARKDDLPVYEARFEIDRMFRDDLSNFAEARKSMIHVFGVQNYADVMSGFAAGERYINRVWSASTDGYIDEVRKYITRALEQFHEARDHFIQLSAKHPT